MLLILKLLQNSWSTIGVLLIRDPLLEVRIGGSGQRDGSFAANFKLKSHLWP